MQDWPLRLWAELTPYLPAGRVALWADDAALPPNLITPPETLLVRTPLSSPKPPKGAACTALVVVATHPPAICWPDFLAQISPLAGPQAPLLLLVPRTGLMALNEAGWPKANAHPHAFWEDTLRASGWGAFSCAYVGGCAWPAPWASAACRLYVAHRRGSGTKIQFNRKTSGTASSTKPLAC